MRKLVASIAPLALSSCATVSAERVKVNDYDTKGIRYYLAAPYLIVRSPIEVSRSETIYQLNPATGELSLLSTGTSSLPPSVVRHGESPRQLNTPRVYAVTTTQETPPKAGVPEGPGAAGTKAAKPSTGADEKPATTSTATPFSRPEPFAERAAPTSLADAVSIQWLPDYCEQYALRQTAVLSGLKVKVTLADGWKLSALESEGDSTALVSKLIDLVGTGVNARRDVAVETIKSGAEGAAEESGVLRYLRRTKITYLKPGLFPLVSGSCNEERKMSLTHLQYETGDVWSELAFVPTK